MQDVMSEKGESGKVALLRHRQSLLATSQSTEDLKEMASGLPAGGSQKMECPTARYGHSMGWNNATDGIWIFGVFCVPCFHG